METLLEKVKQNLILEHSVDDMLLQSYIAASISYAEKYQHFPDRYYSENDMPHKCYDRQCPGIWQTRSACKAFSETCQEAGQSRLSSRDGTDL